MGLDAEDLEQEAALGRIEAGEAGAIRRVRSMIEAARRSRGRGDVSSASQRETYHIDPRNEMVAAAIAFMPAEWREVLTVRHGLEGRPGLSWALTAREVGIRLERAREIEREALAFIAWFVGESATHKSGLKSGGRMP